jgi:SAM-dependent methyltransferase
MRLRFRGRQPGEPTDAAAYRCTSFGHRHHQPIWICGDCGLLVQWPQPTPEALIDAYGGVEDPVYVAERANRYLTFRRVAATLGPGDERALLDIGAYCGYFLDVAREAGFRPDGLELSAWAAAQARALGFTVHSHTVTERADAGALYDVVTMWDVVEHLSDPRAELQSVLALLRPGGQLHLSTIDAGSRMARLLGSRWPWLMDMHLYYFDRRTLPALLAEVGFIDIDVRDYTHVVSGRYLLEKVGASFRPLAPLAAARRLVPRRVRVPINLGDNMLVSARAPMR